MQTVYWAGAALTAVSTLLSFVVMRPLLCRIINGEKKHGRHNA